MFATVRAETSTPRPGISLPHDAVQQLDQRPVVFLAGRTAGRRDVHPAQRRNRRDGRRSDAHRDRPRRRRRGRHGRRVCGQVPVLARQDAGGRIGAIAMIERLIAAALRFRAAVIASVLVLVAAGTWALTNLTVDAFPDLTPNQVDVLTAAPGLSPNEVENLVSYPVETAMMGLPRTTKVQSLSKAGISVVTVSSRTTWTCTSRERRCSSACRTRRSPARTSPSDARPGRDADGRSLSISRRVRFGLADRAEELAGVHDQAAPANDSRRRRRQCVGRDGAAVPGRGRPAPPRRVRPHAGGRAPRPR